MWLNQRRALSHFFHYFSIVCYVLTKIHRENVCHFAICFASNDWNTKSYFFLFFSFGRKRRRKCKNEYSRISEHFEDNRYQYFYSRNSETTNNYIYLIIWRIYSANPNFSKFSFKLAYSHPVEISIRQISTRLLKIFNERHKIKETQKVSLSFSLSRD